MSPPIGVGGINARFDVSARYGIAAIRRLARREWIDVILVVEAKHLPKNLGLDEAEWLVIHETGEGDGKAGVAVALRRSTMRLRKSHYRLGLAKNEFTLDRWVLTVKTQRRKPNGKWSRRRKFRVTHVVPMRGWRYWAGQMARSLTGRWDVMYADFNKLDRAVRPELARAGKRGARVYMKHIVGFAVRPGVRAGHVRSWQAFRLDHAVTALVLWPRNKE